MATAPLDRLQDLMETYQHRPKLDLTITQTNPEHALTRYLLYYLMPLWTAAAVLDWYWHKRTDIEHTSGVGESLIHALMFTEAGVPIILGLLLEINAGLLSAMAATLIVHEATAIWDVSYATDHRHMKPSEQHTRSFLKVLPFMALSMASALHWDQLQSIFSIGNARPDWKLRLKKQRLPGAYLAGVAGLIVGGVVLPYANELLRCSRAATTRTITATAPPRSSPEPHRGCRRTAPVTSQSRH